MSSRKRSVLQKTDLTRDVSIISVLPYYMMISIFSIQSLGCSLSVLCCLSVCLCCLCVSLTLCVCLFCALKKKFFLLREDYRFTSAYPKKNRRGAQVKAPKHSHTTIVHNQRPSRSISLYFPLLIFIGIILVSTG